MNVCKELMGKWVFPEDVLPEDQFPLFVKWINKAGIYNNLPFENRRKALFRVISYLGKDFDRVTNYYFNGGINVRRIETMFFKILECLFMRTTSYKCCFYVRKNSRSDSDRSLYYRFTIAHECLGVHMTEHDATIRKSLPEELAFQNLFRMEDFFKSRWVFINADNPNREEPDHKRDFIFFTGQAMLNYFRDAPMWFGCEKSVSIDVFRKLSPFPEKNLYNTGGRFIAEDKKGKKTLFVVSGMSTGDKFNGDMFATLRNRFKFDIVLGKDYANNPRYLVEFDMYILKDKGMTISQGKPPRIEFNSTFDLAFDGTKGEKSQVERLAKVIYAWKHSEAIRQMDQLAEDKHAEITKTQKSIENAKELAHEEELKRLKSQNSGSVSQPLSKTYLDDEEERPKHVVSYSQYQAQERKSRGKVKNKDLNIRKARDRKKLANVHNDLMQ